MTLLIPLRDEEVTGGAKYGLVGKAAWDGIGLVGVALGILLGEE